MHIKLKHVCGIWLLVLAGISFSSTQNNDVKRIIFEEQRIEGKIRRPQLVLIKADQRPEFRPMIMQSLGKGASITGAVDPEVINESPYKKAFQFDGTKINNYKP